MLRYRQRRGVNESSRNTQDRRPRNSGCRAEIRETTGRTAQTGLDGDLWRRPPNDYVSGDWHERQAMDLLIGTQAVEGKSDTGDHSVALVSYLWRSG